jgi:hypothetical protein
VRQVEQKQVEEWPRARTIDARGEEGWARINRRFVTAVPAGTRQIRVPAGLLK